MGINDRPEELYADCHAVGGMSRYAYEDDPRRLAFTAARYKHVAKMLTGYRNVLEVGCSDGYFSRIVRQTVAHLTAIDIDAKAIAEAEANNSPRWPIAFVNIGVYADHLQDAFDAAYCLDVLEHIPPEQEARFLLALHRTAPVVVIGTPSLESQKYASALSKAGHINCKSGEDLRATLRPYWSHTFLFSMNDEALGTGFLPMAHYLMALCVR